MEKICLGKKQEIVLTQWFEITKAFGSQCEFFCFPISQVSSMDNDPWKTNLARNGDSLWGNSRIFPKNPPTIGNLAIA